MNTSELQTILGYLNIGLAIAHNCGVSIGHFGSTDFIQFAETANSMLLHAIAPTAAGVAAPVVISTPAAAGVAVGS